MAGAPAGRGRWPGVCGSGQSAGLGTIGILSPGRDGVHRCRRRAPFVSEMLRSSSVSGADGSASGAPARSAARTMLSLGRLVGVNGAGAVSPTPSAARRYRSKAACARSSRSSTRASCSRTLRSPAGPAATRSDRQLSTARRAWSQLNSKRERSRSDGSFIECPSARHASTSMASPMVIDDGCVSSSLWRCDGPAPGRRRDYASVFRVPDRRVRRASLRRTDTRWSGGRCAFPVLRGTGTSGSHAHRRRACRPCRGPTDAVGRRSA